MPFSVEVSVHGRQKDARNIEQGFTPGHRNVNSLQDEKVEGCSEATTTKGGESFTS
jgi:ribonuclease HI